MDAERIKAIVELSKTSGACEIALETADGAIRVRRRPRVPPAPAELTRDVAAEPGEPPLLPAAEAASQEHIVRAANVGWFHRGPGPDTEPFVEVGDHVTTDQPLGTIETLKMSNQVTTEVGGEIKEILVEEGMEVEFGQPLFLILPDTQ